MSLYEMLWLAVWALIFFVVGSFGFIFGYLWRKFGEKKTITEAVKAGRDYEAVKTENENLREVIAKRDAEIAAQDKQIKILGICNEDMVPHNCQCGKKPVIDDEVKMQPVPKTFTIPACEIKEGPCKVDESIKYTDDVLEVMASNALVIKSLNKVIKGTHPLQAINEAREEVEKKTAEIKAEMNNLKTA